MRAGGVRSIVLAVMSCVPACADEAEPITIPSADRERFDLEAYPVLLRDCAFAACHGTSARFFTVYGPGRTRLLADTPPYDPATDAELELSHARALSMLSGPDGPRGSPLLRKPLAVSAGGQSHGGEDHWGANVYASKQDPGFRVLFFWATSGDNDAEETEGL